MRQCASAGSKNGGDASSETDNRVMKWTAMEELLKKVGHECLIRCVSINVSGALFGDPAVMSGVSIEVAHNSGDFCVSSSIRAHV